jgi:hypothetical protein
MRRCVSVPTRATMAANLGYRDCFTGLTHMNPVTAFLVFVCLVAGVGVGYFGNQYLAFALFAVGAVIAL